MSSRWHIREAGPEDAEALSHLISVLGYAQTPEEMKARLPAYRNSGGQCLVAICPQDHVVVGFLSVFALPLFHDPASLGRITAMAIEPAYFRQGVGKALVAAAETFAVSHGCQRMEVTSGDHREQDAHLFYAAQGYSVDCRRFIKRLPTQE